MVKGRKSLGLKKGFLSNEAHLLLNDDDCLRKQEVKKKPCISHFLGEDKWFLNSDKDKCD